MAWARWLRAFCLLLAAACLGGWFVPTAARALTPLTLDGSSQFPARLGAGGEFLLDPGGRATIEQVAAQSSFFFWRPTQLDRVYPVGDGQALWIRFVLAPRSEREHWYLEIPFANLDRATLYARGADGTWQSRTAGDHVPVVDWPVPGRQPVLPLTLSSTQPTEHLLRIEHAFATSVPMMLTNEHQVLMRERVVTMGLGIYFGITLLGCVMALAAAVWMRDLASALFVPPTLLLGLSAASFAGINGWLLWPRHAAWNDLSAFALPTLALVTMLIFVSVATAFGTRAPRARWWPWALAGAGVAVTVVLPFLSDAASARATAIVCTALLVGCIAVPAWAWWRGGDRHALGLLIGMVCLAGPATTHVLRLVSVMPTGLISRFVLLSGAALQLAAVMVTLLWRGRDRSLTRQRMRGLDRADPATGLATQAVVREQLRRMTARAQRQEHAYAVLLIDLVNLAEVRHKFGRRAWQELPLRLADRLLADMREVDTVGRLSDTRFVMLMDGPITADTASRLAQQILAQCLRPIRGRPEGWTPRVRMALGVLPRDGQDPRGVLDQLAIMLDTVAPGDSRALFQRV